MCEDRGIEKDSLLAVANGSEVYQRLCGIFRQADAKYNSGLFHFEKEKGRNEPPDELTPNIVIDDAQLRLILKSLYYPQCPYEFSVLPAEVLGNVYEQFLGKVIELTRPHRAEVIDKPEVKKAGGVYYTPSYIVDYIVKNTVGKLCEGKTPAQISKVKILDPACGSGSFLIGAYTFLLDYHRDWYAANNPEKHTKKIYQGRGGLWFLTIAEKKRILLDNIFGVDIDSQAVEVTKLSLLLKVLEGETAESVGQTYKMFHERALPDLGDNIKCGNSLISPDFFNEPDVDSSDQELVRKINAFDWQKEFPEIFERKNPGFDVVIGNPPWLMAGYYIEDGLDYLRRKFESAHGKFDLYYLFMEKGWCLISKMGLFGMIVPNKCFHTKAGSLLRRWLATAKCLYEIVDFGDEQIFSGATNYSCIFLLQKQSVENVKYVKAKKGIEVIFKFEVPSKSFQSDTWHFEEENCRKIFEKIESLGEPLAKLTSHFGSGVQSGADRILVADALSAKGKGLEFKLLIQFLRGRDVRRYKVSNTPKLLIFPYEVKDHEFTIIPETQLIKYKHIYDVLSSNKSKLSKRVWFGKSAEELSGQWYGVMYLDSFKWFSRPHILTPSLSNRSNFVPGTGKLFSTGTAGVTSIVLHENLNENQLFVLGILNSSLVNLYITNHSPVFSGGYYKFSAPYLKKIPIRRIDFSNLKDVAIHDKMVKLVDQMLDLHKRLASSKVPDEKKRIQRQIDLTDRKIDQLVYELYGLTDDEIKIVEESTK
jgi:type I restriction-modification system DNA methylase subunit